MVEQPKLFAELLADAYIERAGRVERIRRSGNLSGWPGAESEVAAAQEAAAEPRDVRVARAQDFLLACSAVAQNMRRNGHAPAADVEIRAKTCTVNRRCGLGWMLWQNGRPKVAAQAEGVLLGMNGKPLSYAGQVKSVTINRDVHAPLEVRRFSAVAVQELTMDVLASPEPEPHDIGL